jgi:flagellar basal-body rod protein FlgC
VSDLLKSLSFAASGMEAQAMRLRHVSENIANADTPGYHRKIVSFHEEMEGGLVQLGPVRTDHSEVERIYDPGHPLADSTGYYQGSNVSLVIEIADAREAQRSYDANLKMFDQARQMTQSLFDLLRR